MNDALNNLVADLRPTTPRRPVVEASIIAGLCLAELLVWLLMDQARPDLMHAMTSTASLWWKLISFGLITVLALATTVAWGAFVFTFNRTQDDYFYVMVWYTFACVISTVIALAVLPRFARW